MPDTTTNPIPNRLAALALTSLLIAACFALVACSPPDSTPKIAEEEREVLDSAKQAAEAMEQTAADRQQDIDAAND